MNFKTLPAQGCKGTNCARGCKRTSSKGTQTVVLLHGRMGDVVYYVRNGRQYVRRYAAPSGESTEKQRLYRQLFAAAAENARIVYGSAHLRKPYEQLWIEHGENHRMSLYCYIVRCFLVFR